MRMRSMRDSWKACEAEVGMEGDERQRVDGG